MLRKQGDAYSRTALRLNWNENANNKTNKATDWLAHLIKMNNNIICFAAHNAVIDIHYHHCFQVVTSITNKFNCTIHGKTHTEMSGFVINQGVKHSCLAKDNSVIVLFIDAESLLGWQLKRLLNDEKFLKIEMVLTPGQIDELQIKEDQRFLQEEVNDKYNRLFAMLFPSYYKSSSVIADERVEQIIQYMEQHIDEKIDLDDIARIAFLSPERARHLFVQHTGMPFSQYLLWKRIKHIIADVLQGKKTIADAAIHYGFTDQPHFSKIFKRMFGTSAKSLLKNSRFIQFLSPAVYIALPSK